MQVKVEQAFGVDAIAATTGFHNPLVLPGALLATPFAFDLPQRRFPFVAFTIFRGPPGGFLAFAPLTALAAPIVPPALKATEGIDIDPFDDHQDGGDNEEGH